MGALLRSPLAPLVLRPAFDRLAVPAIVRHYLPLSRAWAAGLAAEGDADRLISAVPELARVPRAAKKALRRLQPRAEAFSATTAEWETAFFGEKGVDASVLSSIERARSKTARSLMMGRRNFLGCHLRTAIDPVAWAVAQEDEVARLHGQRLLRPAAGFPVADETPSIEVSKEIEGGGYRTQWLRAPSTVGTTADTLWARVDRPLDDEPHPTLIFAHGICMETEFLGELISPTRDLTRSGLVVIRPEGPFHGRRRVSGRYGGEPVMAFGPLGLLDYFEAHVRELGFLTAWARQTFGGPVAVGGVSLGALAAQLVASAAGHWPAQLRPDAFFLVTTSDSMVDVAMEGSLPRALGTPRMVAAHGWDRQSLARWQPLLDPGETPAVAPGKVVMVLGQRDEITPYAGGRRLARRWGVPDENIFLRDLGHFTTSLGLYRDPEPFHHLGAVLAAT